MTNDQKLKFKARVCEMAVSARRGTYDCNFGQLHNRFDANHIYIDAFNEILGETPELSEETLDLINDAANETNPKLLIDAGEELLVEFHKDPESASGAEFWEELQTVMPLEDFEYVTGEFAFSHGKASHSEMVAEALVFLKTGAFSPRRTAS